MTGDGGVVGDGAVSDSGAGDSNVGDGGVADLSAITGTVNDPPTEFWFYWEGHGAPDLTWQQLSSLNIADVRDLGDRIAIPAYADEPLRSAGTHFFPFPAEQFVIEPPTDPTGGEYCANDHYVGAVGINIDGQRVAQPDSICAWNSTDIGDGIIILSGRQLADWLTAYGG